MLNLFEMIKNFKDINSNSTYGDILENKSLAESLSNTEKSIYEIIKNSDRQRLIKSGMNSNGH